MIFSKIKTSIVGEWKSFSLWFRIALSILAVIYISLWFFSIHLSVVQQERGISPVLPVLAEDSSEYAALSQSMISHHLFRINDVVETTRVPGYPAFMTLFSLFSVSGKTYFLVTLVQILLAFAAAVMVRRIGMRFSSVLAGENIGEIAATLLLCNPVTVTLSLIILTDILFLFLFVSGFYLALTIQKETLVRQTVVCSLIFVAAVYVRGMGIFALPIFVAPILASGLVWKDKLKSICIMILIVVACVVPWVARNYHEVGVANFNSFESVNFWWSIPKFLSLTNHTDEGDESIAFHTAAGVPQTEWDNFGWHSLRWSEQINTVAERVILEHPFAYIKFHLVTSIPFLFPSTIQFARDIYSSAVHEKPVFALGMINLLASGDIHGFMQGIAVVWWKFAERVVWCVVILVALYALWRERRNVLAWVCAGVPAYLMLLSGVAAGPRLSLQAWPFLFILCAYGLVLIHHKIYKKI